ncbi:MAG: hypothetical protein JWQ35_1464 [Bacteriovoracaceae bacterium]|nr:hypothetical protein [Bacteriovoracaceae bacterium]
MKTKFRFLILLMFFPSFFVDANLVDVPCICYRTKTGAYTITDFWLDSAYSDLQNTCQSNLVSTNANNAWGKGCADDRQSCYPANATSGNLAKIPGLAHDTCYASSGGPTAALPTTTPRPTPSSTPWPVVQTAPIAQSVPNAQVIAQAPSPTSQPLVTKAPDSFKLATPTPDFSAE